LPVLPVDSGGDPGCEEEADGSSSSVEAIRREVKPPPGNGGSISMPSILLMSMMMSPPTAHPAVPKPPDLIDGERECFAHIMMVRETSSASRGHTTAFAQVITLPLKIRE
jgi:hypothetical protein